MANGKRVGWAAVGWVMSVGAATGWAGTAQYLLQPLEQAGGRGGSWVQSISPQGIVGGGAFMHGQWVPVVWGLDGKMTVLDIPSGPGGTPFATGAQVVAMGPNGLMAGVALTAPDAETQGVVWENGQTRVLASGPTESAWPMSVNTHGQVAGSVNLLNGTVTLACVWDGDRRIDFPKDIWGDTSVAVAINDRGDLATYGWFVAENYKSRAFYVHDGITTEITGAGVTGANVADMNQSGMVIGSMSTADGAWHEYVWAEGVMTVLGPVRVNETVSVRAISDSGEVVGAENGDLGQRATLWKNGVAVDLNTVVDRPTGSVLGEALDISASGVILVRDDGGAPFLLIPIPEPTAMAFVVGAGMIVVGMRRGSRRRVT